MGKCTGLFFKCMQARYRREYKWHTVPIVIKNLHAKQVWWSSLSEDLLSTGILGNVNRWVSTRSILWYGILYVRTKAFVSHIFRVKVFLGRLHFYSESLLESLTFRPFTYLVDVLRILSKWWMSLQVRASRIVQDKNRIPRYLDKVRRSCGQFSE